MTDALTEAQDARAELHRSSYWPAALKQKGTNHLWLTDVHLAATIAALSPAPPKLLTGGHYVDIASFPTVAKAGWGFAHNTVQPGDLAAIDAYVTAARAAGIKLVLGMYPYPYTLAADGSWRISTAGVASLLHMAQNADTVMALFVFNEPYWRNPWTDASSTAGVLSAAQLRDLRTTIRKVWPAAKVWHDIGEPSQWAPSGSFPSSSTSKYADQTAIADFVGIWKYPFRVDGSYAKSEALAVLAREAPYVQTVMGAQPVWLVQTLAEPGAFRVPSAVEFADYTAACRAALPAGSLIDAYVWAKIADYTDSLANHPELLPVLA